ncbi:MAG: DNA-processing protein DprA [Holosporales bacterium]|jgi:DNA processing protein|nr:DNA-processing protein DprA [Holosporales bacterium]
MFDKVIVDWFCLINSRGIGPKTFWSLLRMYKTAEEALFRVPEQFPRAKAEKILKAFDGNIIIATDDYFPKELRRSTLCPPMLFLRGNKELLKSQKIAIIGARNASANGRSISSRFGENLSNYLTVVSGMANGIDTGAHLGALQGSGNTIAIVPFSLENVYPKENLNLFKRISKNGLLVTEVPPHKTPDQGMFSARNRIIALMSVGIVVIEASLKSGTMSTAKIALDFGTEVMAVPGSPSDPRSSGCNNLIKNGAPLVENYTDVLEIIGYKSEIKNEKIALNDNCSFPNSRSGDIMSLLSVDSPTNLELIAKSLNMDMQELLYNISELEILGKIHKCSSNEVVLNA